ncbi:MAG: hypothetical protein JKX81_12240 [Arenicella sp.]|nr:hypothetical protein [Arenicella sp.]
MNKLTANSTKPPVIHQDKPEHTEQHAQATNNYQDILSLRSHQQSISTVL